MNDISTPIMNVLEKVLDVTAQRHKLVVANMANVDTPGYHTKDLDFRSELRRAVATDDEETLLPVVRLQTAPDFRPTPKVRVTMRPAEGMTMTLQQRAH